MLAQAAADDALAVGDTNDIKTITLQAAQVALDAQEQQEEIIRDAESEEALTDPLGEDLGEEEEDE